MNNNENNAILSLHNITRLYKQGGQDLHILRGANLSLYPGRLTALTGPSGAGKTTLLNVAGLLERPTSGDMTIRGRSIAKTSMSERTKMRRKHIGFVFQFHRLLPEFSALENIMIPQMLTGLAQDEATKRAEQLLDMVGLSARAHHRPGLLSGGEQQRVAIARAVANAPDILLADEPTGNLDPHTAASVFAHLKTIVQATDTAALIVTHNTQLAEQMDDILELRDGKIQKVDK